MIVDEPVPITRNFTYVDFSSSNEISKVLNSFRQSIIEACVKLAICDKKSSEASLQNERLNLAGFPLNAVVESSLTLQEITIPYSLHLFIFSRHNSVIIQNNDEVSLVFLLELTTNIITRSSIKFTNGLFNFCIIDCLPLMSAKITNLFVDKPNLVCFSPKKVLDLKFNVRGIFENMSYKTITFFIPDKNIFYVRFFDETTTKEFKDQCNLPIDRSIALHCRSWNSSFGHHVSICTQYVFYQACLSLFVLNSQKRIYYNFNAFITEKSYSNFLISDSSFNFIIETILLGTESISEYAELIQYIAYYQEIQTLYSLYHTPNEFVEIPADIAEAMLNKKETFSFIPHFLDKLLLLGEHSVLKLILSYLPSIIYILKDLNPENSVFIYREKIMSVFSLNWFDVSDEKFKDSHVYKSLSFFELFAYLQEDTSLIEIIFNYLLNECKKKIFNLNQQFNVLVIDNDSFFAKSFFVDKLISVFQSNLDQMVSNFTNRISLAFFSRFVCKRHYTNFRLTYSEKNGKMIVMQ